MFDELSLATFGEPAALEGLEAAGEANSEASRQFAERNPGRLEELRELVETSRTEVPEIGGRQQVLLETARDAAIQELESVRARGLRRTVPLRRLYELDDESGNPTRPGLLIQRLKSLGVNPGGNGVLYPRLLVRWSISSMDRAFRLLHARWGVAS